MAEDWAPGVRLTMTVPSAGPAGFDVFDPRRRGTINVSAGYIMGDTTADIHPVATCRTDTALEQTPAGVVELNASTQETAIMESKYMGAATWQNWAGVPAALSWIIGYATGTAPDLTLNFPIGYRSDLTQGIPLEPGGDLWQVIDTMTAAAGLRLYQDEAGTWQLIAKPVVAGTMAVKLNTGNGGLATNYDRARSRDGYSEAAVIDFQWRDAGGVDRRVVGTYGSPVGTVYSERRDIAIGQSAANAVAKAIVKGRSTRGDGWVITGPACWWLRPGNTVDLDLDGTTARQIIRQIEFDLVQSEMTITTRYPSNLGD